LAAVAVHVNLRLCCWVRHQFQIARTLAGAQPNKILHAQTVGRELLANVAQCTFRDSSRIFRRENTPRGHFAEMAAKRASAIFRVCGFGDAKRLRLLDLSVRNNSDSATAQKCGRTKSKWLFTQVASSEKCELHVSFFQGQALYKVHI
jgi:hypothetical protein